MALPAQSFGVRTSPIREICLDGKICCRNRGLDRLEDNRPRRHVTNTPHDVKGIAFQSSAIENSESAFSFFHSLNSPFEDLERCSRIDDDAAFARVNC